MFKVLEREVEIVGGVVPKEGLLALFNFCDNFTKRAEYITNLLSKLSDYPFVFESANISASGNNILIGVDYLCKPDTELSTVFSVDIKAFTDDEEFKACVKDLMKQYEEKTEQEEKRRQELKATKRLKKQEKRIAKAISILADAGFEIIGPNAVAEMEEM